MRLRASLLVVAVLAAVAVPAAAQAPQRYAGKAVAEVLIELSRQGVRLVFSDRLVTPGMKGTAEPTSRSVPGVLNEILAPHRLQAMPGPAGQWLVVAAREERRAPPPPVQPVEPDTAESRLVFRETIVVVPPAIRAAAGSPTLSVSAEHLMGGAGHAGNVLAPLQSLPGVKSGRAFDGRLVVRGGAPDQNVVLIDGVEVFSPYHVFGLASAFLPAAIEGVEFDTGAFDARYGDRLSSVLSVQSRSGPSSGGLHGSGGVGLLDADLLLEGPVPRLAGAGWLVAGRHSFADRVAGSVLDLAIPSFSDLHVKASWDPRQGQRLSWLVLLSREQSDYRETNDEGEDWTLQTRVPTGLASMGLQRTMGSRALLNASASVTEVRDEMEMHGGVVTDAWGTGEPGVGNAQLAQVSFSRGASVRDWGLRSSVAIESSTRQLWEAGAEAHWLQTAWHLRIGGDRNSSLANRNLPWPYGVPGASLPSQLDSQLNYGRMAAWIQHRATSADTITLQTGLRADGSGLNGRWTLSPRVSAAWRVGTATRVRGAAGTYAQSPGFEKVIQSDYFVDLSAGGPLRSERAVHASIGVERDLARGVTGRVELYRKSYADLIVGRLETDDERLTRLARYDFGPMSCDVPTAPQVTSLPVNGGTGLAYGLDFQIARTSAAPGPRLTGWVSYSYGVARRTAYGYDLPFDYDRRHAFGAVAQLALHPSVTLSATLRLSSGAPWTSPAGLGVLEGEDVADEDGDGITTELVPARDDRGHVIFTHDLGNLSRVNGARLPSYARLDARVTYHPHGLRGRWTAFVDMINLLNRDNPGLVSCRIGSGAGDGRPGLVRESDYSIPVLPSFGIRFRF